jgi:hypothetical protein
MARSGKLEGLGGEPILLAACGQSNGTIQGAFEILRDWKDPELSYSTFTKWVERRENVREILLSRRELLRADDQIKRKLDARRKYSSARDIKNREVPADSAELEIVAHEGDLEAAAESLGISVIEMTRMVAKNSKLQAAQVEGRELKHMRIENDLYKVAAGDKVMATDQMRAAALIAKARMGFGVGAKKAPDRTWNPDSVPEASYVPDIPVVKPN